MIRDGLKRSYAIECDAEFLISGRNTTFRTRRSTMASNIPRPPFRKLRCYAIDHSLNTTLATTQMNPLPDWMCAKSTAIQKSFSKTFLIADDRRTLNWRAAGNGLFWNFGGANILPVELPPQFCVSGNPVHDCTCTDRIQSGSGSE